MLITVPSTQQTLDKRQSLILLFLCCQVRQCPAPQLCVDSPAEREVSENQAHLSKGILTQEMEDISTKGGALERTEAQRGAGHLSKVTRQTRG